MARFLVFLLFIGFGVSAKSQLNNHPITNYTPREYGQECSSYTLSVVQDSSGLIYVGTAYGVLQFDGLSWRFIPVKVGSYVTSLAYSKGTIYLGCQGDFGMLVADNKGKFTYQSLASKIPKYHNNFNTVWKTLVLDSSIVFQTGEEIFVYANDTIECISPETSFHLAFVANNKLYVRERNVGLMYYADKTLKPANGGDAFKDFGVFQILPLNSKRNLILTRESGQWILEDNKLSRLNLPKDLDQQLAKADIQNAIVTSNGDIAICSLKDGVFVLDSSMNIRNHYNLSTGMISSEAIDIAEDYQGTLWIATKKGVSRIQHSLPISIFNQTHGLYGSVQAVEYTNGKYIIGTTEDLFVYQPDGIKTFQSLGSIKSSIWDIESSGNRSWIAADNGLWLYFGGKITQISKNQTSALEYLPSMNWLISSGMDGTFIYNAASNSTILSIPKIKIDAYGIASTNPENGMVEIWIGSKTKGVWQLSIQNNKLINHTNYYGLDDGLNEDWTWPFKQNGKILFASASGTLKFISAHDLYLMQNGNDVKEENLRGLFDLNNFPKNSTDKAITAYCQSDSFAFVGMDYHVNIVSLADSLCNDKPLRSIEMGRFNSLRMVNNTLLVGADDGFAVVDIPSILNHRGTIPKINFRSISIGQDSTIWFGDSNEEKTFTIPYQLNSVEIRLSANYLESNSKPIFYWELIGSGNEIIKKSENGIISLPNLWEGNYEVVAYAQNVQNESSEPIHIKFAVLPPFYRTIWAYVLYFVLLIAVVLILIRLNTQRLRAQNKKLEEIVCERTREVVEQKEQIQIQKDKIEDILNDIRASINYAQRIQQAMLPSKKLIEQLLPGHFIIFYPRDVVSGDYYWAIKIKDKIVITVADCTGHGVPGAFMSMLGISLLNEIVGKMEVTTPSQILEELRGAIIQALKQSIDNESQKDGMDMSLVSIDTNTLECQWAGANNPLYIFRPKSTGSQPEPLDLTKEKITEHANGLFVELKQDRMPVAIYTYLNPFTNHTIQLSKGDRLYLFSDGIVDQFGGPKLQKFMSKNLKNLIMETGNQDIHKQGSTIKASFEEWVNPEGRKVDQIDDVTFLGFEV